MGRDRQTLRRWVRRYNAARIDDLDIELGAVRWHGEFDLARNAMHIAVREQGEWSVTPGCSRSPSGV
jgi:hypothetical protein